MSDRDEDKGGEYVAYLEGMNSHLKAEMESARAQQNYPDCDTCGGSVDYMPWHYATETERHLHSCDECWPMVNPARAQSGQESGQDPIVWINPVNIRRTMIASPGETVPVSAYRDGEFTSPLYTHPQPAQQGVPEGAIKAAVEKFLQWKLPEDFYPDGGVSFDRAYEHDSPHWPVGTNLLTAEQAERMLRECLSAATPQPEGDGRIPDWLYDGYAVYQNLSEDAKKRTFAPQVSDTLDAIVTMLKRPQPPQEDENDE